jgi:hypothetical protein
MDLLYVQTMKYYLCESNLKVQPHFPGFQTLYVSAAPTRTEHVSRGKAIGWLELLVA